MSDTTRASLLIRIRDPKDSNAWSQFEHIYSPLLYRYARARGLSRDDAEDVRAACYITVVEKIGDFKYEKERGGFKAWLRTLAHRRIVDLLRKRKSDKGRGASSSQTAAVVDQVADPGLGPDEIWETHWKNEHLKYCIQRTRTKVSTPLYQAFSMLVMEGRSVEDVCAKLGMNSNQVYKAKSRFLARVRDELSELGIEE